MNPNQSVHMGHMGQKNAPKNPPNMFMNNEPKPNIIGPMNAIIIPLYPFLNPLRPEGQDHPRPALTELQQAALRGANVQPVEPSLLACTSMIMLHVAA